MDGIFGDGLFETKKKPSQMQRSERPGDKLTIEEMRLDLCSRIGPYRVVAGKSTIFTLRNDVSTLIAEGRGLNKVPSFIRIEAVDGYDPFHISLSTQQQNNQEKQTATLAGYIDVILLAGERLYAIIQSTEDEVAIKVTEITV